jgi:FkbM family methyltransferase
MPIIRLLVEQLRDAFSLGLLFPLRHMFAAAGSRTFRTRVKGAGSLEIRSRSTDADVVRQVFRKREYDFSGTAHYAGVQDAYRRMLAAGEMPLILDIGANIGASAVWFSRAFPDARVIAVEPDPGNAEMCRRNIAGLRHVKLVEAAIGGSPGMVSLANQADAWAVRTVRDAGGEVPVRTIGELVAGEGEAARLFIAKIDIEGFEADLFEGDVGWIDRVKVVLIEPHDWLLPGQRTSRNFLRAMAAREFEMLVSGENLIFVAA